MKQLSLIIIMSMIIPCFGAEDHEYEIISISSEVPDFEIVGNAIINIDHTKQRAEQELFDEHARTCSCCGNTKDNMMRRFLMHRLGNNGELPLHQFLKERFKAGIHNPNKEVLVELSGIVEGIAFQVINTADLGGETPLMTVVREGNIDIAMWLLSLGANQYAKNASGQTAYDLSEGLCKMLLTYDITHDSVLNLNQSVEDENVVMAHTIATRISTLDMLPEQKAIFAQTFSHLHRKRAISRFLHEMRKKQNENNQAN